MGMKAIKQFGQKDKEILLDEQGIKVWVDETTHKVVIEDENERNEYDDTLENRQQCLTDARNIIEQWEREQNR